MPQDNITFKLIVIALSLAAGLMMFVLRRKVAPAGPEDAVYPKVRRKRKALFALGVFLLWLACGLAIGIFKTGREELEVSIMAPRMLLYGFDVSTSVVISWLAMAILIAAAVLIRLFVIPKFKETPRGLQNALETAAEAVSKYTADKSGGVGEPLGAYIFALGALLVTAGLLELFGLRPPTADLEMTGSLALCTFFLINYYGIKRKGVGGRLKSFAHPSPIIFPFKILSDIATPVSLACRLFGNMIGGMIVVDLLYMALGSFGVGIPGVAGLYFNLFHPIIQAFVFITLSLTFISEAVEE
ncbi:MAG TPA: FoF1 ATP synthase subunit a [Candidatus Acidoferrum sp.]|nr:FoF1 ATP synthase subunit a [Candidatus Acidoferrum sp.]